MENEVFKYYVPFIGHNGQDKFVTGHSFVNTPMDTEEEINNVIARITADCLKKTPGMMITLLPWKRIN